MVAPPQAGLYRFFPFRSTLGSAALASGFEQNDPRGDAYVQRGDFSRRPDAHDKIVLLFDEFVQALLLAARDDGAAASNIRFVMRFLAARRALINFSLLSIRIIPSLPVSVCSFPARLNISDAFQDVL